MWRLSSTTAATVARPQLQLPSKQDSTIPPRGHRQAPQKAWDRSRRTAALTAAATALGLGVGGRARARQAADPSSNADDSDVLRQRLQRQRLQRAQLMCPSWGISASTSFPGWLFGEWEVCSRPVAYGEPLGPRFVDENTKAAIREDFSSADTAASSGDVTAANELHWKARYYWDYLDKATEVEATDFPSGFLLAMPALAADSGVVQFRAFNAGEELKAFLKQPVPRLIADADPRVQPLQINVSFPIEEEEEEFIRTVSLKLEASKTQQYAGNEFVSSELFRQVVSTEGEIDSVGDFEVLNAYTFLSAGHVTVQNRVAKYLVPGDPLFEEAGNQAVSWLDYSWDLRRTKTCIGTPYGEQCADLGGESQMGVPYM